MNKPATMQEIKNLLALHSATCSSATRNGWIKVKNRNGDTWMGIGQHHDIEWWIDWIKRAGISS